jgi:SCP-2 sterol transfer family
MGAAIVQQRVEPVNVDRQRGPARRRCGFADDWGWLGVVQPPHRSAAAATKGDALATRAEVEKQLEALMARLDGNEAGVRSAIPDRKVFRCQVPDLDASWYSVVEDGHVSPPREAAPDRSPDITLRIGSDDLVDLVEGRVSFLSAFASGRVKVDASLGDLLRLRTLL